MVSIKWPLVSILLSVICSAQAYECKNFIRENALVKDSEWSCTYPGGQLTLDGHFTLNQDIKMSDLKATAQIFGYESQSWQTIMNISTNLCKEYEMHWMGKWRRILSYTDIPQLICYGVDTLEKDTTYHVNNWPVTAGYMNVWDIGYYTVRVTIALGTTEEIKKNPSCTKNLFKMQFTLYTDGS